jgi:hypothetical protein
MKPKARRERVRQQKVPKRVEDMTKGGAFEADWDRKCEVCGASPVVNATGLCGPCTFGEANTANGNWIL